MAFTKAANVVAGGRGGVLETMPTLELRDRAALVRAIFDAVPGGVMRVDVDGSIVDANTEALRIMGATLDEVKRRNMKDFESVSIHEDGSPFPLTEYPVTRVLATGQAQSPVTVGARRPDGTTTWTVCRAIPERHADGTLVGAVVSFLDITERKRAEERLQRSETIWRTLAHNLPDYVLIADRHERIVTINRTIEPIELQAVIGTDATTWIHEDDVAVWRASFHAAITTRGPTRLEHRGISPNDTTPWYDVTFVPILEEGKEVEQVLIVGRDITEQRKMIARLAEKERLASVGMLAASVAHEVMNPLMYVLGNLDYALSGRCKSDDSMRAALVDAREGAARLQEIVRDLRTLGRSGTHELLYVDVRTVLEMALRLGGHEIARNATVKLELDGAPGVLANESRLCQVFISLLMNAAQAMEAAASPERTVLVRMQREEGGHVAIDVTDTGPGISLEDAKRIFEPFFTTRPDGTGLGLSIARSSVEKMGGRIEVSTTSGRGATFTVWLPTTRLPPDVVPEAVVL